MGNADRHRFRPVFGELEDLCHCATCGLPRDHATHDPPVAGPPDLAHAIQAADERDHFQAARRRMREAFTAVRQGRMSWDEGNDEFFDGYQQVKEAFAALLLSRDLAHAQLQATRDRLAALQAEHELTKAQFTDFAEEAFERSRVHAAQIEKMNRAVSLANAERNDAGDRLADLEVSAADLADLLERSIGRASRDEHGNCMYCHLPAKAMRHGHCWECGTRHPDHLADCPVGHALQADPPARGRAILDEVERYRVYHRALFLQVLAYRRAALDTPAERNALQGLVGIVDGFEETAGDLGAVQEEDSG